MLLADSNNRVQNKNCRMIIIGQQYLRRGKYIRASQDVLII